MAVTSPAPHEPGDYVTDQVPPGTLLAAWTEVFPLSRGLDSRIRQHTGPQANAELVEAVTTDYVRELSARVPNGCRITTDGALFGPSDFDGNAQDVLFMAVFTTDLDSIAQRHSAEADAVS